METKSNSNSPIDDQQPTSTRKRRRIRILNIPILPQEIIQEILSRLPVKSLLRFRCVSKSWCSLISSKNFIKTHLQISRNDTNVTRHWIIQTSRFKSMNHYSFPSLFGGLVTNAVEVDFPFYIFKGSVDIVGCCNGLVCLDIGERFFLWNPSTRKYKKLPDVGCRKKFTMQYGFGFDECNEDYKVLVSFSVLCDVGRRETVVKIYSLRTNSWKRIEDFGDGLSICGPVKFVSRKLHWGQKNESNSKYEIFSFDLGSEICGNVAPPPDYVEIDYTVLGEIGGCLCVCDPFPVTSFDVWVMKEYGVTESWAKLVTVPYCHLSLSGPFSLPLCIGPKGEILLMSGPKFMIYSPRDNQFRHLTVTNFCPEDGADIYYESLVSLV